METEQRKTETGSTKPIINDVLNKTICSGNFGRNPFRINLCTSDPYRQHEYDTCMCQMGPPIIETGGKRATGGRVSHIFQADGSRKFNLKLTYN
ncbi:hypothetical protein MAR_007273 [Mya arenaria]|uniref:Uncharacterized protein n=1 Tax=Mya arenaria TaxID=6604 RepID=A0ABY7DDG6_MYAAR|nr:hypothetical protein MAR_007273 [Mya arenaria]